MKISFRALVNRLLTYPVLLPIMPLYKITENKKIILDAFYFIRGFPHGYLKKGVRIAFYDGFKIMFPFIEDSFFDDVWLRNVYYPYNPQKDDIVMDIGAHMGFFTIKIAKKVKKVIAIEPYPINYKFLRLNICETNLQNKVITFNVAIGEKNGQVYLKEDGYGGGRVRTITTPTKYLIQVKSIDSITEDLKLENLNLIKIDTEGDEIKCLKGSVRTLKRYRPNLIIAAYHFNDENIVIEKFLQKFNYKIFRYFVPYFIPLFLSNTAELYIYAKPKQL